jgi:hypothetical protein
MSRSDGLAQSPERGPKPIDDNPYQAPQAPPKPIQRRTIIATVLLNLIFDVGFYLRGLPLIRFLSP